MDFIIKLLLSESGNNSIFVIVDHFTKFAYFIACREGGMDSAEVAKMYYRHIFTGHGLPDDIVSDRGSVFDGEFWRTLQNLTRTKLNMSTVYHPQTDSQTERVNQSIEQFLRIYCNYQQDDWEVLLPLAQYVYNDTYHSATKTTPFFTNYGFHLQFTATPLSTKTKVRNDKAEASIERMQLMHQVLRQELGHASDRMKKNYDKNVAAAPIFAANDQVWLSAQNIVTKQRAKKLDHKYLGPYKVVEHVGDPAYQLALSEQMLIHEDFRLPKTVGNLLSTLPTQRPLSKSSIAATPTNQRPQRIDRATAIGREVNDLWHPVASRSVQPLRTNNPQ
jgi:hypothetical protein